MIVMGGFNGNELPLFFDREKLRDLRVREDLKKRIWRQDKEAREFAKKQDLGSFLGELYLMAIFYSEKITKEAQGDQKLSLILEFSLWREVQYYARQVLDLAAKPDFEVVLNQASLKLFELAKTWLKLHDVGFSEVTISDLANGGIEKDFLGLSFTPSATSIPGKLAKKLTESRYSSYQLCYSPWFTGAQGWAGKLTDKALYVSCDFVLKLAIDPDTGHELSHWQSAKAVSEFRGTPFLGDVLKGGERPLPMWVGPYDGGVEFDELEAYGYNMRIGPERLKQAKTERELLSEVVWLRLEAQSGMGIAYAIEEILTETLQMLEKLAATKEMTKINFTSNRRANSDPRDARWYSIGTGLDCHFGFQITDLKHPGSEYVRGMVFSNGWLVGAPIFGTDVLKRAKKAIRLHQQKSFGYLLRAVLGKKNSPIPFFLALHKGLVPYFEKQKALAMDMGKDFQQVASKASAYLNHPSQQAKEELLKAFQSFSKHPIGEAVKV